MPGNAFFALLVGVWGWGSEHKPLVIQTPSQCLLSSRQMSLSSFFHIFCILTIIVMLSS